MLSFGRGTCRDEAIEDFIGVDGVGLGMEIQQDAMTQNGNDDRCDVVVGDVIALARESARLGGEHDELRGADAAAVVYVLLYEVGSAFGFGARGADQAHDVARQQFGDGNHAHQLLEIEQSPAEVTASIFAARLTVVWSTTFNSSSALR